VKFGELAVPHVGARLGLQLVAECSLQIGSFSSSRICNSLRCLQGTTFPKSTTIAVMGGTYLLHVALGFRDLLKLKNCCCWF